MVDNPAAKNKYARLFARKANGMAGYYETFVRQHGANTPENHDALEKEVENIFNAILNGAALNNHQTVTTLAWGLGQRGSRFLDVRGYTTEAIQILCQAVESAHQCADYRQKAFFLNQIGLTYTRLGRYADAVTAYNEALTYDYPDAQSSVRVNLAWLHAQQGRCDAAIQEYARALRLARQIGDRKNESDILIGQGGVYLQQGRMADADSSFEQARRIARAIPDALYESCAHNGLGNVQLKQLRFREAITCYEQALALARQIRSRPDELNILNNLGTAYLSLQQPDRAKPYLEEARQAAEAIGNVRIQAAASYNLALIEHHERRITEAVELAEDAVQLFRVLGMTGNAKIVDELLRDLKNMR
jgi:tetratricopeptide (TPR) repeat protein